MNVLMNIEMVLKGFGCDWCGEYTEEGLRKEFNDLHFPNEGPDVIRGWYSNSTDTVLILGGVVGGKYTAYVWNTPLGRELVLQNMGRVFGFINLPTRRR